MAIRITLFWPDGGGRFAFGLYHVLVLSKVNVPSKRVWWWGPVILYLALITLFSSLSHPPVPSLIPFSILHVVEFFGLGILLFRALFHGGEKPWQWSLGFVGFLGGWTWGLLDEFHQSFVPGRVPDGMDVLADGLGMTLALVAGYFIHQWTARKFHG